MDRSDHARGRHSRRTGYRPRGRGHGRESLFAQDRGRHSRAGQFLRRPIGSDLGCECTALRRHILCHRRRHRYVGHRGLLWHRHRSGRLVGGYLVVLRRHHRRPRPHHIQHAHQRYRIRRHRQGALGEQDRLARICRADRHTQVAGRHRQHQAGRYLHRRGIYRHRLAGRTARGRRHSIRLLIGRHGQEHQQELGRHHRLHERLVNHPGHDHPLHILGQGDGELRGRRRHSRPQRARHHTALRQSRRGDMRVVQHRTRPGQAEPRRRHSRLQLLRHRTGLSQRRTRGGVIPESRRYRSLQLKCRLRGEVVRQSRSHRVQRRQIPRRCGRTQLPLGP